MCFYFISQKNTRIDNAKKTFIIHIKIKTKQAPINSFQSSPNIKPNKLSSTTAKYKKSLNSTINQSINPKNSVQSISSSNQRFNSQKPLQPLKTQANPPFSLNISIKTPKCFIKFKEKLISKKNCLIQFFNKKCKTFKLTENVHFSTVEIFKPCFVFFSLA